MSEKKFHSPAGAVTDGAVQADFESAARFDKAFVGALGVYYRDGFKTKYVPYPLLERAFSPITGSSSSWTGRNGAIS